MWKTKTLMVFFRECFSCTWWFSFVNVFHVLTCVYQGVIFLMGQPSKGLSIFILQGHFSKNNRLYSWFILFRKILFFEKFDKLNWTIYTFIIYFCCYVPPPPWKWKKKKILLLLVIFYACLKCICGPERERGALKSSFMYGVMLMWYTAVTDV